MCDTRIGCKPNPRPGSFLSAGSYRTFYFKLCYRVVVVSKLLENLLSVGAERGRRTGRLGVAAGKAKSRAHDSDVAIDARRVKMLYEPALGDLRMLEHFGQGKDLAGGHTMFVKERRPLSS